MPSTSRAISLPGSSARSTTQTFAPSSAKRLAVSRPMPPAPPVTTATFPSRRPGMLVLLRGHEDVLYLGVIVESVRAELAPHARLLHPAKRCCDPDGGVGVYGQYAGLDAAGGAHGSGDVLRPERAGETVDRVVGEANGVLFVLEGDHGHNGAEDLLLRRPVPVVHGRQDGWRIPKPGAFGRCAPDRHGRVIGDVGGHLLTAIGAEAAAFSRSASAKMTLADLPPSSSVTRFMVPAAPDMMPLPTSVEPVKATLATSGCSTSRFPTLLPGPTTTLTTPSGIPASRAMRSNARALSGVSSAGLRTSVLPAARAGAIFQLAMVSGKFQGTMRPTTPSGSRNVTSTPPETGMVSPSKRSGIPA